MSGYSPEPPWISEELQQLAGGSHHCGSSVTLTCFLQADAKKYSMSVSADTEDRLCLSNGEFQKQTEELPSYIMLASWHLCKTTRNCLLPFPESKPHSPSRRGLKPWSATHCKFLLSDMLSGRGLGFLFPGPQSHVSLCSLVAMGSKCVSFSLKHCL